MPGFSYGLPASGASWVPDICKQMGIPQPPQYGCTIGAQLAQQKGTVCSKCYADNRGFYTYTNSRKAQAKRLSSLWDPKWVETISELIERKNSKGSAKRVSVKDTNYFRWHDSGDLLGMWHLDKLVEVAKNLPKVSFWLPTREVHLMKEYQKGISSWDFNHPSNLIIRVSSHKVSQGPLPGYKHTSTVHVVGDSAIGHECPAPLQGNQCGTCRACWKKDVPNVSYKLH